MKVAALPPEGSVPPPMFARLTSFGCAIAGQPFLAYVGSLILRMWFAVILPSPTSPVADYVVAGALGVGIAWAVFLWNRGLTRSGSLVWIGPLALFIWALLAEGLDSRHLTITFAGRGEGAWLLMFVTLPTFGCICYAGTMAVFGYRSKTRR